MTEQPTQVMQDGSGAPPLLSSYPPQQPPQEPKRRWLPWVIATIALVVALVAAAAAVLVNGSHKSSASSTNVSATYQSKLAGTLTPVVSGNISLSKALQAVDGSQPSLRAASNAAATLQQETTSARGALSAMTTPASQQLTQQQATQAITQEAGYVQAVSSTLSDPSGNASGSLQSLASATNSAFVPLGNVAPGGSTSVYGVDNLLSWVSGAQAAGTRNEKPKVIVQNNTTTTTVPGNTTTTTVPNTTTDPAPNNTGLRYVDKNIQANGNVSDGLAENTFSSYWSNGNPSGDSNGWGDATISAYSSASSQSYTLNCTTDQTTVWCSGTSPQGNDLEVQFPMWAVQVY